MFLVSFLSILLSSAPAGAAMPQNCLELGVLYKADGITQYEDQCFDEPSCLSRQSMQLRETAKLRDPKFDPTVSDSDLEQKYGSDHTRLILGADAFDGTSLFLKLVSSTTYFEKGSTRPISISQVDGKVQVGGEICSVPLAPYLSSTRIENLCKASVDHIDLPTCLDGSSEFRIDNVSDDATQAVISLTRNGAGTTVDLFCVGTVIRASDEVVDVTCLTQQDE